MKWLLALFLLFAPAASFARARFVDPRHGVSFQYPRKYTLKRGVLDETDIGLGFLGAIPMEFVSPGGVRIATVEAPRGSYPGTDFVNAFFTLSVNESLTEEECMQFPDRDDSAHLLPNRTIGGLTFRGVNESGAATGHQVFAWYYHAYSQGECIELGYGLATAGFGDVEGLKQAPYQSIESRFSAILDSVRIQPRAARSPDRAHHESPVR